MKNRGMRTILFAFLWLWIGAASMSSASSKPGRLDLHAQHAQGIIQVEALLEKGKKSDYKPLGQGNGGTVELWSATKATADGTVTSQTLQATLCNDGFGLTGIDATGQVLLTPVGADDSLLVWQGDQIIFSIDEHQHYAKPSATMVLSPGLGSNVLMHLGGMLHLKMDKDLTGSKIVVETDTAHIIAGVFCLSAKEAMPQMKALWGVNLKSVDLDASLHDAYVPLPCGKYPSMRISLLDNSGSELQAFHFSDVTIERASITTLNLENLEAKAEGGATCSRPKIQRLQLFQRGVHINSTGNVSVTQDTTSLSSHTVFSGAAGMWQNQVHVSHFLCNRNPVTFRHYWRYANRNKRNDPEDSYWDFPAILQLSPGENRFHPAAIAFNQCGTQQNLKFIKAKPEIVWLYIKTYTCDFSYKGLTRNDSLCGYVPEWNRTWNSSESVIDWEFQPSDGGSEAVSNRLTYRTAHRKDNHLKFPLSLQGVKQMPLWTAASYGCDGYYIVKHGVVKYQAATVYRYTSGAVRHIEATESDKRFTTDILEIDQTVAKNSTNELEFTSRFKTSYILSFGDSIDFNSSYFDGYERGLLIYEEEEFKKANNQFTAINRHKHLSRTKGGEEFKCVVTDLDERKTYNVWAYLQIGDYLFISEPVRYPLQEGIFADLPACFDPYTPRIQPYVDQYVEMYRKALTSDIAFTELQNYEKELFGKYQEITNECEKKVRNHVDFEETIPYTVEEGLSYEIVSPIKKAFAVPPDIFEEIPLDEIFPGAAIRAIGTKPVALLMQHPMVYCAAVRFKIKILNMNYPPTKFLGLIDIPGLLTVHAYVPGNGPDGKSIGYTHLGYVSMLDKKPGDIVDVQMIIVGWGPREVVDQMKSLVFSVESHYKQYETWLRSDNPLKDPFFKMMEEWYKSQKQNSK